MASERSSQASAAVDAATRSTRVAIRERELGRVLHTITRGRTVLLSTVGALTILLGALGQLSPRVTIAATSIFFLVLSLDLMRLSGRGAGIDRHLGPMTARPARYDVAVAFLAQTLLIWSTGGIESPLIIVYPVLGLLIGVAIGPDRFGRGLIVLLSMALWGHWAGRALDLTPGLPPALGGPGPLAHPPAQVLAQVSMLQIGSLVGHRVGRVLYALIDRMLDQALGARAAALGELTERNRELVALSAAIAHELKNPLASVQGLVQLLERGGKNAERRFEVLRAEIGRMREILDAFLNFSRPVGELSLAPGDLEPLLAEIAALHEALLDRRGLRLPPVALPGQRVTGDRRKLKQALVDLLQNAIEASPEGAELAWWLEPGADRLVVGVRDGGPGFDPAVRARAGTAGVTTKPGGSGIGLAVARLIAEQHGGALRIEDAPGGGARVGLELPRGGPPPEGQEDGP
jgi:two-component system sensor histidine kinase HydH